LQTVSLVPVYLIRTEIPNQLPFSAEKNENIRAESENKSRQSRVRLGCFLGLPFPCVFCALRLNFTASCTCLSSAVSTTR
jgi:hypothetical protein